MTGMDHRMHHRLVMGVVGMPLHHVADLSGAFRALGDAVKACEIMCAVGYNHRDLSPGNIIVGTDGQGRLGDLKLSTRFMSEEAGHVERTRTPEFTAVEVLRQFYHFFSDTIPADFDAVIPPFHHNAGHDLESIWWIAVYLLYNTVIGVNITHDIAKKQKHKMDRCFSQVRRILYFRTGDVTLDIYQDFHESPAQPAVQHILHPMLYSLHTAYIKFERQGDMTNNREFLDLHQVFHEKLVALSTHFEGLSGKTLTEVLKPLSASAHHPRRLENGSERDAGDSEQSTKVDVEAEDQPDGRKRKGRWNAVVEAEEPRPAKRGKPKVDIQAAARNKESSTVPTGRS